GAQGQLEYDFVVTPGADPSVILLAFDGVDELEVDEAGDLQVRGAEWALQQRKPVLYQEADGVRREIAGGYVLRDGGQVGFAVERYDRSQPLIIDPVLGYSTYLGGTSFDRGSGIAVDAVGNAYVTGFTSSTNFPITPGAAQHTISTPGDAFVTKLNPTRTALAYSTYLGGSSGDSGSAIAVDTAGNPYVTGFTRSPNFPTTSDAVQPSFAGFTDAFMAKLNPTGTALAFSTYLGGSGSSSS